MTRIPRFECERCLAYRVWAWKHGGTSCAPVRFRGLCRRAAGRGGAALMEVLLALALFVAAAAVVTSALNASLESLERQRLGVHGLQLAASVIAEMQLGIRPLAAEARRPLAAPFEDWSCEIVAGLASMDGLETAGPRQVEVIVRHEHPPLVQRLSLAISPGPTGSTHSAAVEF